MSQRYEVYAFKRERSRLLGDFTTSVGFLRETFENEEDAKTYSNFMNKTQEGTVFRVKVITEGWIV